ncbi:MAG: hypothetical protein IJO70_00775 [Lachnospiraceae bacterium]|nr:hypothetical protein [Lachnospiraceae bacterium]
MSNTIDNNRLADIHARKYGYDEMLEDLNNLPFNSLIPILVGVMQGKVESIMPNDIMKDMNEKMEIYGPSNISQLELTKFRTLFYKIMPSCFDTIQLPPVSPLGLCTSMTKLGQNERLTTIRKSEVVSDSTLYLALYAATLRKKQCDKGDIYQELNLSTFHRLLRLQKFEASRKWSQHFEILGTISTGRRKGKNSFKNEIIYMHINMWISFLKVLNSNGYYYGDIEFLFSFIPLIEWIIDEYGIERNEINRNSLNSNYDFFDSYNIDINKRIDSINELSDVLNQNEEGCKILKLLRIFEREVLIPLKNENPNISFGYEVNRKLGLGYFNGICFHGYARNRNNQRFDLIDGGVSDWVGQMTNDNKEVTVTSSFGVEVGIMQFRDMRA